MGESEVREEVEGGGADALGERCGGIEEGWDGCFLMVRFEGGKEGFGLLYYLVDAEERNGQLEELGEEDACQWIEVPVLGHGLGLDAVLELF